MRKLITVALAASALAGAALATATPASAQPWGWRHHYWGRGPYWGPGPYRPYYGGPPGPYGWAPRHCWWRYGYRVCRRW